MANGQLAPFIKEQMDSLQSIGINCVLFPITENGISGYLKHFKLLMIRNGDSSLIFYIYDNFLLNYFKLEIY